MIRWRSSFFLILAINLLHFSSGSQSDVNLSQPGEESCDLPCVDKIANSIFKHVADRYTALELSIIQKLELQLTRMEQIVEERITKIETLLKRRTVETVDIVHGHGHEESLKEIRKIEHNTTHFEVVKDLVSVAVKNDTLSLSPESKVPTTAKPEKIDEVLNLVVTTTKQPDDCAHELTDYDEDYAQQFIEARMGANDQNLCLEAKVTVKPSTEGSKTKTSSTSSVNDDSEHENFIIVVGQPSVSEKPVYNGELDSVDQVEEEEASTTVSEIDYIQTVVQPSSDKNVTSVNSETTAEKIKTSNNVNAFLNQNIQQVVFFPPDDTPDFNDRFIDRRPTDPPKKKLQPWIRTSTVKPKIVTPKSSSISTTTVDPNTYKIHFPTESVEIEDTTTPKHGPIPKPPQVFRYAKNYLNGTWTIIHSRYDGSISFNRSWTEYRTPFGRLPGEYWMGLEALHQLTKSGEHELLVVLKGFDGTAKTAMYDSFRVGPEVSNYRLALGPFVGGDAGDSFSAASGQMFSTYDRDNDRSLCASCGELYSSGWWFKDCADANLNGLYVLSKAHEETSYGTSMNWWSFNRDYQGLKEAAMLIRKRSRKLA